MNRYITTAIPYVNAQPHIGHALEYVQADALIRAYRAKGDVVRGQYGTDDNSLKNVRAAQAVGEETEAYVARHAEVFKGLKDALNLTFDDFVRTREERHMKGAQKLWSLCNPDDIYTKSYTGLYCVGCEQFYTEEEAPGGVCGTHKKPLEKVAEENYFFRLSKYQRQLEDLIVSDTLKIVPETRKNEALGFIRQGLQDFSISRSVERAEHWGVPVPNDPSQVMYVWVDALSNYITALGFAENADAYKQFWTACPHRMHVIGKDIMRFHVVYWPAFLLSAGLPLPTEVFVHGFFTVNGEKMSKSLGNVLNPFDLLERYGADGLRYAFLRSLPLTTDGDISMATLDQRYNELANGLGNLVGRCAAMANKYFEGRLDAGEFDAKKFEKRCDDALEERDWKTYIDVVWDIVALGNERIDKEAPFKTVKTDPAMAKRTLSDVAAMIRWCAKMLAPVIPRAAEEIVRRYNGDVILSGEPLFPKREEEKA